MPNVALSTAFVTSSDWLLRTSPEAKGWWAALLGYCTREENGGRIAGAARWSAEEWGFAMGKGGSVEAVATLVSQELAKWKGDDLIVVGYAVSMEHDYQLSRAAGKKGAEIKKQRKRERLEAGDDPESPPPVTGERMQGTSNPSDSSPGSPPDRGPVWSGVANRGVPSPSAGSGTQNGEPQRPEVVPTWLAGLVADVRLAIRDCKSTRERRGRGRPIAQVEAKRIEAIWASKRDPLARGAVLERLRGHFESNPDPSGESFLAEEGEAMGAGAAGRATARGEAA
jgi:hypothetical protein